MFEWLSAQNPIIVYIFLIFNATIESLLPPYPSDVFVALIAFSAGQGHFNPYIVYGTTCVGSVSGIMIVYALARCRGEVLIRLMSRTFLKKLIPLTMIERAKRKFAAHGDFVMIMNRFLPGMRAPLCFAAGIARVSTLKMFLYSLTSVLAWNFFLVIISYRIGSSWDEASTFLRNYNILAALVIIILVVVLSFVYYRKSRRR